MIVYIYIYWIHKYNYLLYYTKYRHTILNKILSIIRYMFMGVNTFRRYITYRLYILHTQIKYYIHNQYIFLIN